MSSKAVQLKPNSVGREFVRCYYTILNQSPENLHCFYNDNAIFIHDDIDPNEQKTVSVVGKQAIRNVMMARLPHYRHSCTIINGIDTVLTINNGLVIQVYGEISHNDECMRPFSQSFILALTITNTSPNIKYYVHNEIFRFRDFMPAIVKRTISECERQVVERRNDANTTFMGNGDVITICAQDTPAITIDDESYPIEQTMEHIEKDVNENKKSNVVAATTTIVDNEQEIMEIQSKNLKNILQEPRSITKDTIDAMKRIPSPPLSGLTSSLVLECQTGALQGAVTQPTEGISELFRDKCILTIGNVVNPNIEFDDEKKQDVDILQRQKVEAAKDESNNSDANEPNVKELNQKKCVDVTELQSSSSVDKEQTMIALASIDITTPKPNDPEPCQPTEKLDNSAPAELEPKTYADLVKLERETPDGKNTNSSDISFEPNNNSFSLKERSRIRMASMRRKSDKVSPPKESTYDHRPIQGGDLLQVFIGNIPHKATEEDLRIIFGRFGRIIRFRIHENSKKDWLPHYGFVTYENMQSVRKCLAKRNSIYYPENSEDSQKLNVNGDESIVISPEGTKTNVMRFTGNISSSIASKRRDLNQFHKNFLISDNNNNNYGDKTNERRQSIAPTVGVESGINESKLNRSAKKAEKDRKPAKTLRRASTKA